MRIVFMGTPDFSVSFLDHLTQGEHSVVGVVTQPDRPSGRGRKLTPPPVKVRAEELGLPLFQPEDLKSTEFNEQLRALEPDLFVVVAFSILPLATLSIPKNGSMNIHTSLLPKYRGAAPIQWAMVNGETKTGVTLFQLDEKMDHGPIIEQNEVEIDIADRGPEVYAKLLEAGKVALDSALTKILSGYEPIPQDHSLACGARKLKKEDGAIDFDRPVLDIHNQIRGLFPWPSCYAQFDSKVLKILKSIPQVPEQTKKAQPGDLLFEKGRLFVKCQDSWLEILELQPQGKKPQDPKSFYNGLQQKENLCLTKPE